MEINPIVAASAAVPATEISEAQIAANRETVNSLLRSVNRAGMEAFITWLNSTDFFTAPASTKYHNSCKGGLCQHTLNVYYWLEKFVTAFPQWLQPFPAYTRETAIIAALLHDLAKVDFYVPTYKNKKVYCPNGSKWDAGGNFEWQSVVGYECSDEEMPLPHAEKSMVMAMMRLPLTEDERYAIRWHMGFTEPEEHRNVLRRATEDYPLVLLLQMADNAATYFMESSSDEHRAPWKTAQPSTINTQ